MKLPIDVVRGTNPVLFRWRQLLETPIGMKCINHEGPLSPTVESAVADLIGVAKQLEHENVILKMQLDEVKQINQDLVASHSDQLSKLAELQRENETLASRVGCDVEDQRITRRRGRG